MSKDVPRPSREPGNLPRRNGDEADINLTRTTPAGGTSYGTMHFAFDTAGNLIDVSQPSSRGLIDPGRFPAGTVIAERYRVIEMLGRGGMGEVYRADDLKLGQSIALKFLAGAKTDAPASMGDLFNEVRVARQVSHANVCRVYDIGEIDGYPFITMEYVDGDNLASLLKRIGRLPQDKALDIARQLCAGLAAAHEASVIHRDLKPTNVMIDGRGRVRITDFGLAGLAEQFRAAELRAGTPAYMSPEQLEGREVTFRSDIYALGLVLYEAFTGKRAFKADSLDDLSRLHRESTPTRPSRLVDEIDPAVERIILRCLEKEPRERPASAISVAAALPGGDPLAAALAAGETPSPELVAAAGPAGGLTPWVAVLLLCCFVGGILTYGWLSAPRELLSYVALEKSPAVLVDRGREILMRLGYPEPPVDTAHGFQREGRYVESVGAANLGSDRWEALRLDQPPAIIFWYRESPKPLTPNGMEGVVGLEDPPLTTEGMKLVLLSPRGRLEALRVVPPRMAEESNLPPSEANWSQLFELAGLNESDFEEAPARWNPFAYCDARRTWVGHYPQNPGAKVWVEAASYRGKPVHFEILGKWNEPPQTVDIRTKFTAAMGIVNAVILLICLVGAGGLARRNARLGRVDRRGALRTALIIFTVTMVSWLLGAAHVANVQDELNSSVRAFGIGAFSAALAWLLYLALEPAVRRRWPDALVSWTRLLAGRLRDPAIGRDLLVGGTIGVAVVLLNTLRLVFLQWAGAPPAEPDASRLNAVLSTAGALQIMIEGVGWSISSPMFFLMLLVLLMIVCRSRWIATVALGIITLAVTIPITLMIAEHRVSAVVVAIAIIAMLLFTLVRFGLLAVMAAMYVQTVVGLLSPRLDFNTWYGINMALPLAVLTALALYAFYISLAGRPLWRADLLDG